jgi:hypothetical protein
MAGQPLRSPSRTFVRPSLNIQYHCLTVPSLITCRAKNIGDFKTLQANMGPMRKWFLDEIEKYLSCYITSSLYTIDLL